MSRQPAEPGAGGPALPERLLLAAATLLGAVGGLLLTCAIPPVIVELPVTPEEEARGERRLINVTVEVGDTWLGAVVIWSVLGGAGAAVGRRVALSFLDRHAGGLGPNDPPLGRPGQRVTR